MNCRVRYCDVKGSQCKSSAEFKHCELVSLPPVLKGPMEPAVEYFAEIMWDDNYNNYKLSFSANATTQYWLGAGAKQLSVNSVSTSIKKYQLSITVIKLAVSSKWQRSHCQVTLQKNGVLADQSSQQTLWGRKGLGSVSQAVHLSLYLSQLPALNWEVNGHLHGMFCSFYLAMYIYGSNHVTLHQFETEKTLPTSAAPRSKRNAQAVSD